MLAGPKDHTQKKHKSQRSHFNLPASHSGVASLFQHAKQEKTTHADDTLQIRQMSQISKLAITMIDIIALSPLEKAYQT